MEIDPKNAVQWVVMWRWPDGVLWTLSYTLRTKRYLAIWAFNEANDGEYAKLRKQGKAKAMKVRLELAP